MRCTSYSYTLKNSLCCRETKLTAAYSSSAANTKRRHTAIQMSMAFTEALEPELCVVMVSTVVMPSPTLAGAASMLIQNETQDRMTHELRERQIIGHLHCSHVQPLKN
ncbi:hypothetical protein EYF80_002895 [Liparis tanakae]|uniref:Uncharacterized protein n=1 Tax=Liparis tanakae TaxID=230148 RepID=A0A4Z2JBM7_9TELE|nr:hypothetical protein EYF80_002895 [Liparis tanakae]